MLKFNFKKYIIMATVIIILFNSISHGQNELMIGTESPLQDVFEKLQQDFGLKSKSAILMECRTGQILFENNSHERLAPASITKIMPMLLFMEAIDNGRIKYDDVVVVSDYAQSIGGSQIWLEPGEHMTVRDLMKAVVINSANDATVAIAEHIAGSEEIFVRLMNERAKQLGMVDTNYVNCCGLDADDHYTSAFDVAIVSKELMNKHPQITQFTTIWMDSLRNGEFGLANTNKLIRHYKGANGIKTGSTGKAGFCLSASAVKDNLQLISVVMSAPNSKTRFLEASKLLNYGFANYQSTPVRKKGESEGKIQVIKGMTFWVDAIYPDDVNILIKKGEKRDVKCEVLLDKNIVAPVKAGQKLGSVIFKIEGSEIGRTDVVAGKSVDKATLPKLFKLIFTCWVKNNAG